MHLKAPFSLIWYNSFIQGEQYGNQTDNDG
jgi:hypothetical protein